LNEKLTKSEKAKIRRMEANEQFKEFEEI